MGNAPNAMNCLQDQVLKRVSGMDYTELVRNKTKKVLSLLLFRVNCRASGSRVFVFGSPCHSVRVVVR